jgi:hypothetical protein
MIITISAQTSIKQIQEAFTIRFPFLKLEFFIDANADGIFTANEMIKDHDKTIGDLTKTALNSAVEIHGSHTITELEQSFKTNFGLIVQVFHNRNHTWIVSTTSDRLSLEILNARAEEVSKPLNNETMVDPSDRMELE